MLARRDIRWLPLSGGWVSRKDLRIGPSGINACGADSEGNEHSVTTRFEHRNNSPTVRLGSLGSTLCLRMLITSCSYPERWIYMMIKVKRRVLSRISMYSSSKASFLQAFTMIVYPRLWKWIHCSPEPSHLHVPSLYFSLSYTWDHIFKAFRQKKPITDSAWPMSDRSWLDLLFLLMRRYPPLLRLQDREIN